MTDPVPFALLKRLSDFLATYGPLPADEDVGHEITEVHSLITERLEVLTSLPDPDEAPSPPAPTVCNHEEVIEDLNSQLEAAMAENQDLWQGMSEANEETTRVIEDLNQQIEALEEDLTQT